MVKEINNTQTNEIIVKNANSFLINALTDINLPTANLLVPETDRIIILKNVSDIISKIPVEKLPNSFYMSKFIVASFAGLFDSALNYLWNETIVELRKRIISYDLQYFYSNNIAEQDKAKFKDADDLKNLSDQTLLDGCKKLDLIDKVMYEELNHIRYMRNWVSAAHPNNYGLTGYKMLGYLDTCINLIKLQDNQQTADIKRILNNIKSNIINEEQANLIKKKFESFTQNQINTLCSGLFGIYVDLRSTQDTISNIEKLIQHLWIRVDEETRRQIGLKYSDFSIAIENEKMKRTERFLSLVEGLSYLSKDVKASKIKSVLENLKRVHYEWGNFYSEPTFALELKKMVGNFDIPEIISKEYVLTIVDVFLTNGNGVCNVGDEIYKTLISKFNEVDSGFALLSFLNANIKNKLLNPLCSQKYKEMVLILNSKITDVMYKSIAEIILEQDIMLYKIEEDSRIKEKLNYLKKQNKLIF